MSSPGDAATRRAGNPASHRAEQWRRLAERETDPRFAAEFDPITRGPLAAVVGLMALGGLAAVNTLVDRMRRRPGGS